jgi:hypothetical protein
MSAGSSLWRVVELMAGIEFMAGGPALTSSRSTNSFTTASCPFIAALASGVQPYLSLESASTVVRKTALNLKSHSLSMHCTTREEGPR